VINLILAHFVCDYPLQGDNLALGKNRNVDPKRYGVDWQYWMLAHAATHGMAVSLLTGRPVLGLIETAAHFVIDFTRCEKWISLHLDQALHILCKAGYALAITNGWI
jgi:hypothetical protein